MAGIGWIVRFWRSWLPSLVLAGFGAGAALAQPEETWELVEIGGVEHVTIESVKRFYRFTKLTREGDHVLLEGRSVAVKLELGFSECLMNGVKFILTKPLAESAGVPCLARDDLVRIVDPVLRPNFIKAGGMLETVILDPGHGGGDRGETIAFGREADVNLAIANLAKAMLEREGYKVVLTRVGNAEVPLAERVETANAVAGPAVFVSIHQAAGKPAAHCFETRVLTPPAAPVRDGAMAGNAASSAAMALATAVHCSLVRSLGPGTVDHGIRINAAVPPEMARIRHPGLLAETGCGMPADAAAAVDPAIFQKRVAIGIVAGVNKYRVAIHGPQRPPKPQPEPMPPAAAR